MMGDIKLKNVSEEMQNRIIRAMSNTWQAIASDMFQCLQDCGEKTEMTRAAVIEVVCDAGHIQIHGGDTDAYKVFNELSYTDMKKLGRKAFTYTRYC
jgi:hypothetical protein